MITLSKFAGYQGVSMEVKVLYDVEKMDVAEVHHIMICDVYDNLYVNIADMLFEKFPSIFNYIVHSVNWEEVYLSHLQDVN
jgi:hypothetical protein